MRPRQNDQEQNGGGQGVNRKIINCVLLVFCLMLLSVAQAQQTVKTSRVGYVSTVGSPDANYEELRQGLRDLGYVEGKNIAFEYRAVQGKVELIPGFIAELVQMKVDLLFCANLPAIHAAKEATKTIPIVMISNVDPVELGLVESFARPGGNITGMTLQSLELSGKRLELLKETFPKLNRVALVWNVGDRSMNLITKQVQAVAPQLGVTIQPSGVRDPSDLDSAFAKITQSPPDALFSVADRLITSQRKKILEFAAKNKIPTMFDAHAAVEAGALMSYGPSRAEVSRRAAVFVDKILKGARPADLPVEQPMKFELLFNLKTAKELGLTIPPHVLARADRVIK
jgi:putative ABC transport system substrate-binding protein